MATLTELQTLWSDAGLRNRVRSALVVKCAALIDEDPGTDTRRTWALDTLGNVGDVAAKLWLYLLGSFASLTVAQIQGATDSGIQDAVNAAVDQLVT